MSPLTPSTRRAAGLAILASAAAGLASVPGVLAGDSSTLPRVLVIGDSISMNYHDAAKAALDGVADYHRIEGNAGTSANGVENTAQWIAVNPETGRPWDVIQFNHGLHDLRQDHDADSGWGDYNIPIADYQANLEKQIALLRTSGARLIWCTTTPVPNDRIAQATRRKGACVEYNAAALEVMRRHPDILINDLHAVIEGSPVFDEWRTGNDVHFHRPEERQAIAEAVAASVLAALEPPAKNLPVAGETFWFQGRPAFLIRPDDAPSDKPQPWVWYAPTLPRLPGVEEKWMFDRFLAAGIAIAGVDVGESMGNPEGRAIYSAFHRELVTNRGMAAKPALLARSRGGLMLYNWAVENPDDVAAIAGVYPVGDLTTYPGLEKAARAYGMTADELGANLADHNPIERLAPLAAAKVPILHVHGDRDTVVPLERNSGLIKQRYDALGGPMTLVLIEGGGHDMNQHWFQNAELVDFVIQNLTQPESAP